MKAIKKSFKKEKCKRCGMFVDKGSKLVGHAVGCDLTRSREDM